MSNKLTNIAKSILKIEKDLPTRFYYKDGVYVSSIDDFNIYIFDQIWSNTTLGFVGDGVQCFTDATTYVFVPLNDKEKCFVYFNGIFAYSAPYSETFMKDVLNNKMEPATNYNKYYGCK